MNYPIWQLDFSGGGLLIACMAIIHVYISHFAVGGGLFLVLTEHKALRENSTDIMAYVKRHTKFFMLLTMVAGSLTGVGIWFTISLLNPSATSALIHLFLFAWAIEWTFFFVEILSLFLYYHTFGKISDRNHLILGWIYFGTAIMSLFVINGIIDFMLTPGQWLETGNFWDAFFNPTFWPAFFFRAFLAIIIAGLFGFVTASAIKKEKLRLNLLRFCAKWLLAPFVLFLGSAWWYRSALPPGLEDQIFLAMPETQTYIQAFIYCSPLLILGAIFMAIRMPVNINRTLTAGLLVIGLLYIGSFEFIREAGRRPYIIHGHMYSNSILKKDMAEVSEKGVLQYARWVENRHITENNKDAAGRELFDLLCLSCHSIGGPLNDIRELSRALAPGEMELIISTMGTRRSYMPPFPGTEEEKRVLMDYMKQNF